MVDQQQTPNNTFDMQNPNSWYSNPQIPLQGVRWWNFRGEDVNEPENPKCGDCYFDLTKKVFRVFSSQYFFTLEWFNYRTSGYDYKQGNYVLELVLWVLYVYECLIDHTSNTSFAVDFAAGKRQVENTIVNRRQPEYSNFICTGSIVGETINSGVLHQVALTTYDTNNGYAKKLINSITIPEDGTYLLNALSKFSTGDQDRHLWIYKNWVSIHDISIEGDYYYYEDSGGGWHTVQVSKTQTLQLNWLEKCEKDDIISIYIRQNSSWALTVDTSLQVYKQTW